MRRGWEKDQQVRVSGPMTDRIGNPQAPRSGTPTRLTSHPARAARRGNPKRYLPGRVPMFRSAGARFRRSEIDLREKRSVGTPRLGPPVSICHFRSDQQGSFSARAPNRGPKRLMFGIIIPLSILCSFYFSTREHRLYAASIQPLMVRIIMPAILDLFFCRTRPTRTIPFRPTRHP